MSEKTVTLKTGRVLLAATVAAQLRNLELILGKNPLLLYRVVKFADRRLADHLVEAELLYLHDLGLVETDGRLHPDFHDVLAACVSYTPRF